MNEIIQEKQHRNHLYNGRRTHPSISMNRHNEVGQGRKSVNDEYGTMHPLNCRMTLPSQNYYVNQPLDTQLKRNMEELRRMVSNRQRGYIQQSIPWNDTHNSSFVYRTSVSNQSSEGTNNIRQTLNTLQQLVRSQTNPEVDNRITSLDHTYTKDYLKLSLDYKINEPYRVNNPIAQIRCIICKTLARKTQGRTISFQRTISKVFFPCEHICVCDECFKRKKSWIVCPLCDGDIKLVVSLSGNTKEEYLMWVEEIKPQLPVDFIKEFTINSKQAIAAAMAKSVEGYVNENTKGITTVMEDDPNALMEKEDKKYAVEFGRINTRVCTIM